VNKMTLNEITTAIFNELASNNKPIVVHSENNILKIKVGEAETSIMYWETMSISSILNIARGLLLKENYKGNVLLHG